MLTNSFIKKFKGEHVNMKIKRNLFVLSLITIISLVFTTGALAADTKTNDVNITVQSGEFSVTTSDIRSFGDITLAATPETYVTSFENSFITKDLRGTQEGWRLDVEASPFTSGTHTLPGGSLSIAPLESIERVGTGFGDAPTISTNQNVVIDQGTVEIAKAVDGTGMGVFELTFPNDALSLVVDATTAKVGTYQSTLTWTLVTAP